MLEIVAEISGCHGGSLDNAKHLIVEAHINGATGVKFQCFDPERLARKRVNHPRIQLMNFDLLSLYQEIYTPHSWFKELIGFAEQAGHTWHASVFDVEDVKFLEELNCPRYKISSFETFDNDLVAACMRTRKPLIISVNQDENYLPPKYAPLTILHATNYGVPAADANLKRLRQWAWADKMFPGQQWLWGLSDHTTDSRSAEIATAFGAKMIEWHIRLPGISTTDLEFSHLPLVFGLKAGRVMKVYEAMK
jgi:sialic acid synthase SpsE